MPRPRKSLSYWLRQKRSKVRRHEVGSDAGPFSIGSILDSMHPIDVGGYHCPITISEWQHAVGLRIADRTAPKRLDRDGTLLVTAASSVWAQELSMLSSTVCERLCSAGHKVRSVRFVVSAVEPARRAPDMIVKRYVPAPKPLPAHIIGALNEISDESLRSTIAEAIAASIAAADL